MKKGWKIFWIVCASCAGIGLICCMAALILGVSIETIEDRFPYGFGFPRHIGRIIADDDDYEEREGTPIAEGDDKQSFADVREIDMYVCGGEVEIWHEETSSGGITIETNGIDKRLKLQYYMDGDVLKIKTKKKIAGINNANGVGKICLYVPKNFKFDAVDLELLAGSLYVEDISAGEFSVNIGAGEAQIDHFYADEADIDCGTGSLDTAGQVNEEVDINCGIGEIHFNVQGKQTDYNYDISCGIGEVVCGSDTYSGIGSEKEIDNGAPREMNIECGIGSVTVNFSGETVNSGTHHTEPETGHHGY